MTPKGTVCEGQAERDLPRKIWVQIVPRLPLRLVNFDLPDKRGTESKAERDRTAKIGIAYSP